MNMLTGFSAHLCDVVQKPRRRQKPIVTIVTSERSNYYFCDCTRSYTVLQGNDAYRYVNNVNVFALILL